MGAQVKTFELVRAQLNDSFNQSIGALAQIDDRQDLINLIKAGSRADLILFKNNNVIDQMSFSLKGSTSAVGVIERNCGLRIK